MNALLPLLLIWPLWLIRRPEQDTPIWGRRSLILLISLFTLRYLVWRVTSSLNVESRLSIALSSCSCSLKPGCSSLAYYLSGLLGGGSPIAAWRSTTAKSAGQRAAGNPTWTFWFPPTANRSKCSNEP